MLTLLTVLSTYRIASSLVKRVGQKRNGSEVEAIQEKQLADLADALALGPPVIEGQYKHEFKRFGEAYACGDAQAREQMKDLLLTLQITVTSMQIVFLDNGTLDYASLQSASDDCRINTVVCLGQLSQRISAVAQAKAILPYKGTVYPTSPDVTSVLPSLQHSSSPSSGSASTTSVFTPERTAVNSLGDFEPKPLFAETAPFTYLTSTSTPFHGRMTNPQGHQHASPPLMGASSLKARLSIRSRRPSSEALLPEDTALLINASLPPSPAAVNANTAPLVSSKSPSLRQESPDMARNGSWQAGGRKNHFGCNDSGYKAYNRRGLYGLNLNYNSLYENVCNFSPRRQSSQSRPRQDTRSSNHSTQEHIIFLQNDAPAPPIRDYRAKSPSSIPQPLHSPPPAPPPPKHERTPSQTTKQQRGLSSPQHQRAASTNLLDRKIHAPHRPTVSLDSRRTQAIQNTNPALAAYHRHYKPLPPRPERPSTSASIPVKSRGPPPVKYFVSALRRKSPYTSPPAAVAACVSSEGTAPITRSASLRGKPRYVSPPASASSTTAKSRIPPTLCPSRPPTRAQTPHTSTRAQDAPRRHKSPVPAR